jgi:DNA-binding Lrp family transcriptional regulator
MLSDILREDVVVLSEPNKQIEPYLDRNIQTFGQNIHMLLANRFFMDSTIGRKSEELITNLFEMLRIEESETPTNVRKRVREKIDRRFAAYINEHKTEFGNDAGYDAFIWKLIGSIGEDFYRRQLLGMFEEYKRKIRELNPPVVNEKETESRELEAVRKLLEKMKADDIMQKEDLQHALELLGQL